MKRVPSVVWFAIRAVYDELFTLAGIGLIWFVIAALPFIILSLATSLESWAGVLVVVAVLSVIPLPPATGALYRVAMEIAREKRIEFNYFWQAFKSHFWLSWKLGGIVLLTGIILAVDVLFYLSSDNIVFSVIGFMGLWAFLFWFAIQVYLFPLIFLQEDKRVLMILKNAFLLTMAYPFFALGILIVTILATALSGALALLLVTIWMPFVAILNSRAAVSSVRQVEDYRRAEVELEQEGQEKE